MKNTLKIAALLALSLPLVMVGCTCGEQNAPDEVVPMEEPVTVPGEGAEGAIEEEGAPAEGGAMDEGHSEDDGHEH